MKCSEYIKILVCNVIITEIISFLYFGSGKMVSGGIHITIFCFCQLESFEIDIMKISY